MAPWRKKCSLFQYLASLHPRRLKPLSLLGSWCCHGKMLFPRARRRRRSFGVRGRILNSRRGITHAILHSRKHLSLSLQTCSVVLVVMTKMHRSKLLLRCSLLTLARDPKIILPRPSTLCLPSLSLNFFLSLSLCIRFFYWRSIVCMLCVRVYAWKCRVLLLLLLL